jgi:hypothetical protein
MFTHESSDDARRPFSLLSYFISVNRLVGILLNITNKMQRYTIFFITVNALHVSGGFSAHHQELKTVYTASGMSGICQATASVGELEQLTHASGSSKQAWHIPDAVFTVFSS